VSPVSGPQREALIYASLNKRRSFCNTPSTDLQITGGSQVQLAGVGALQISANGSPQISLTLTNLTGGAVVPIEFTNVIITPDRKWPMLALRAREGTVEAHLNKVADLRQRRAMRRVWRLFI
jgi:hypothetical protein